MKHLRIFEEYIPGGRAAGKSLKDLAKAHGVGIKSLEKQLKVGVAVEMEHTNSEAKAEEIAMDHLAENPRYYTKLVRNGFVDEPKALKIHKELYEGDWFDNLRDHPANQDDPDPTREIHPGSTEVQHHGIYGRPYGIHSASRQGHCRWRGLGA